MSLESRVRAHVQIAEQVGRIRSMPTIKGNRHVLAVRSVEASSRYYQDVLGFEETMAIGDDWRFLSHGSCRIMLGQCPDEIPAGETGNHSYFAYWDVDDAAALHESWKDKGAEFLKPLTDEPWGQREFSVRTPDGHRILVGEDIG